VARGTYPIRKEKFYNFGIEAMSQRVRRAIGKPQLTNRRIVDWSVGIFARIEHEGTRDGDIAWHLISGLPGQSAADAQELGAVLWAIDRRLQWQNPQLLSLHWQPLHPLPGTPMQWCAAGGGSRDLVWLLRERERMPWLRVRQFYGRTDDVSHTCTILSRSDERGAALIERLGRGSVKPCEAEALTGATAGAIPLGASLPWNFVAGYYPDSMLERAYLTMMRRLTECTG
jgi:hypothetical protein